LCRASCAGSPRLLHSVPPPPSGRRVDAGEALAELAVTLRAAYEAEPGNALLARELRMTLQALLPVAGPGMDGDLAGLFAELGGI